MPFCVLWVTLSWSEGKGLHRTLHTWACHMCDLLCDPGPTVLTSKMEVTAESSLLTLVRTKKDKKTKCNAWKIFCCEILSNGHSYSPSPWWSVFIAQPHAYPLRLCEETKGLCPDVHMDVPVLDANFETQWSPFFLLKLSSNNYRLLLTKIYT